jgi:hypothetical protein
MSERYMQKSRGIKDRAKQKAENKDCQSAKDTWLKAVKHLQAATRISWDDSAGLIQIHIQPFVCRSLTTQRSD